MARVPNLLVLSNKRFATDFRKYLMRATERAGGHASHIYCWEAIIVSRNGGERTRYETFVGVDEVIRDLGDAIASPLIVLTGLGCNELSFATELHHALPSGIFIYDVYDDLRVCTRINPLLRLGLRDEPA